MGPIAGHAGRYGPGRASIRRECQPLRADRPPGMPAVTGRDHPADRQTRVWACQPLRAGRAGRARARNGSHARRAGRAGHARNGWHARADPAGRVCCAGYAPTGGPHPSLWYAPVSAQRKYKPFSKVPDGPAGGGCRVIFRYYLMSTISGYPLQHSILIGHVSMDGQDGRLVD